MLLKEKTTNELKEMFFELHSEIVKNLNPKDSFWDCKLNDVWGRNGENHNLSFTFVSKLNDVLIPKKGKNSFEYQDVQIEFFLTDFSKDINDVITEVSYHKVYKGYKQGWKYSESFDKLVDAWKFIMAINQ